MVLVGMCVQHCTQCDLDYNWKSLGCSLFRLGHPCRSQFTAFCHYLPEVPLPTKANASIAG